MELRIIADSYRAQKAPERATLRAEQRSRFKTLAKGLRQALDGYDAIEARDLIPLLGARPGLGLNDVYALADQLRLWTPVAEQLASKGLPRGQEENMALTYTCGSLAALWEREVGSKATHHSYEKAQDTRSPQSPFGRFVVEFFKFADPGLDETVLVEPLKKVTWKSEMGPRDFKA